MSAVHVRSSFLASPRRATARAEKGNQETEAQSIDLLLREIDRANRGSVPDSLLGPGCPAAGSQVAGVGRDGVQGHGGRSEKEKGSEERGGRGLGILWAGGGEEATFLLGPSSVSLTSFIYSIKQRRRGEEDSSTLTRVAPSPMLHLTASRHFLRL